MHIGLIGGIGPAATVFYYERIVRAFADADQALQLTIGHTSVKDLARNNSEGRRQEQAEEYARVTRQLAAAGADRVVITSMGGHFCAAEFAAISPLPMIDGPAATADYLKQQGIRRIGILGTRVVMETALYGALANIEAVVPQGDALAQVHDDYLAVAVAGVALPEEGARLLEAGASLVRDQGAEAVLLGGTDLSLVYDGAEVDFRVIDSAAAHADAIVQVALNDARQ